MRATRAYYFIAFAAGNLLGPLTLGHLFDSIGRKQMIAGTYIVSAVLLAITATCSSPAPSSPSPRPSPGA